MFTDFNTALFKRRIVHDRRRFTKWKYGHIMIEIGHFNPLTWRVIYKPLVLTQIYKPLVLTQIYKPLVLTHNL
jgi:hypothetical protein